MLLLCWYSESTDFPFTLCSTLSVVPILLNLLKLPYLLQIVHTCEINKNDFNLYDFISTNFDLLLIALLRVILINISYSRVFNVY